MALGCGATKSSRLQSDATLWGSFSQTLTQAGGIHFQAHPPARSLQSSPGSEFARPDQLLSRLQVTGVVEFSGL